MVSTVHDNGLCLFWDKVLIFQFNLYRILIILSNPSNKNGYFIANPGRATSMHKNVEQRAIRASPRLIWINVIMSLLSTKINIIIINLKIIHFKNSNFKKIWRNTLEMQLINHSQLVKSSWASIEKILEAV